ncbi:CHAT domain-containing protein [Roseovarius sp. MMSF_3281]|uniref:CHAT domain-containing protein n=1 Tax=Roseovarius sp. MMSF_3281 TaxID=3046694 RepID=UPI00273DCEC0|nr:CHAT domain-containing protein [Roseovarius sp. MMSF_3281]
MIRFYSLLVAGVLALVPATGWAASCAELAAPMQSPAIGVRFDDIRTEAALLACEAAVEADPADHASRAHLARVYNKLGQQRRAFDLLDDIRDSDDPDALAYLGVMFDDKDEPWADPALAFGYFERAAAAGNLFAMSNLSNMLMDEDGAFYDPERGQAVRRKAAEGGNPFAAENLARNLMYGDDANEAHMAEAVTWYKLAAKGRSPRAMAELGRAYRYEKGVKRDDAVARAWWEKGDALGNNYSTYQLANLYRFGNGVAKDLDKAAALFTKAGDNGYAKAYYALGRLYRFDTAGAHEKAVKAWRKAAKLGYAAAYDELGVAYYFGRGVPQDYAEAARLSMIGAEMGNRRTQATIADMLFNGIGVTRDEQTAVKWYQEAVEDGYAYAMHKLAIAYGDGRGVEQDLEKAFELYSQAAQKDEERAFLSLGYALTNGAGTEADPEAGIKWYFKSNSAVAKSNIAELYQKGLGVEQSDKKARYWYRRSSNQKHPRAMRKYAEILIEDGTPDALQEAAALYLTGASRGDIKAERRLNRAFAQDDDPLAPVLQAVFDENTKDVIKLGRRYEEVRVSCLVLLVDCGKLAKQKLHLANAANWYRRAGGAPEAQFRLGRLLSANPQVAQGPTEAADVLAAAKAAGNADAGLWLAMQGGASPRDASEAMRGALDGLEAEEAARLALLSVVGRFGDDAIGPGWTWLEAKADAGEAEAQAAIVGAALFLGNFDMAAKRIKALGPGAASFDLEAVDYTLRQALTFLMGSVRDGVTPDAGQLDDIGTLLDVLAETRAEQTGELRLMLKEVRYRLATREDFTPLRIESTQPADLRLTGIDERIADKTKGLGESALLVPLYQERARILAELGNLGQAEEAVYKSVAIAKSINDQSRHITGSLVYHMEMACNQRKGSDLLFDIGAEAAGLALAKSAVNHLQSARGKLLELPQNLQNCFRDLLSDQYRRMADLLIRNDYFDEAQVILAQLKDFETYRYSGGDSGRVGAAFDPVPMSGEQEAIMTRIHGLPMREMIALEQRLEALPEEEADAIAEVEAKLDAAHLALSDSLDELSDALDAMDTDASVDLAREVSSRTLRRLAGRLDRLDSVAMVYSVSLPERTHFLIVTGAGTEHRELEIGQEALTRDIEDLRAALGNPRMDPAPAAEAFYKAVWAPVEEALDVLPADGQVLLVLDGVMRYVPVAALRDARGWLVERRNYVTFTPASRDLLLDDEPLEDLEVEALGASRGGDGFEPLPYVRQELESIVGIEGKQAAILPGRAWLDDRFDAGTLETALESGAPIVHVATHFDLTESEDTSRLLLGNGETVSIAELKKGARRGRFDFADVHMLVLSACRTGVGNGSELESLATEMQYEGVRSVLATLWPVADVSTAAFMGRFYEQLKAGASRSEALHSTQRFFAKGANLADAGGALRGGAALQESKADAYPGVTHPFYWAGFRMIGQWR